MTPDDPIRGDTASQQFKRVNRIHDLKHHVAALEGALLNVWAFSKLRVKFDSLDEETQEILGELLSRE